MRKTLVLGSRGSALALAQVELVKTALAKTAPALQVEVRIVTTSGDLGVAVSRARTEPSGAKGLFTREIEEALRAGEIDAAVHSLKDLPGRMEPGLCVAAVLARAAAGDVLVTPDGADLAGLAPGAVIGTSSVRRARQLRRLRPDATVAEFRGNVPTRLEKLRNGGKLDGIVLAEAGLARLGYFEQPERLQGLRCVSLADQMLPAVGQGVVAIEVLMEDKATAEVLAEINDATTWDAVRAEREFLRLLDGDCAMPVGVRTTIEAEALTLHALVFDGDTAREGMVTGSRASAEALAQRLFEELYGG